MNIKAHIESLVKLHYYLRLGVMLGQVQDEPDHIAIVFVDNPEPKSCVVTPNNYELVVQILTNTKGPGIRSALTNPIPSFEQFVEAGGDREVTQRPFYKATYSGECGCVWTIGGKFRGKATENGKGIRWIPIKE